MSDRPIIFSGPMVPALLAERDAAVARAEAAEAEARALRINLASCGRAKQKLLDCPGRRCPACRGSGRVALPDEEIVAAHVEEARRVYWPAWDRKVEERR